MGAIDPAKRCQRREDAAKRGRPIGKFHLVFRSPQKILAGKTPIAIEEARQEKHLDDAVKVKGAIAAWHDAVEHTAMRVRP